MSAPKVLIENQNALGSNVEQVTLDTNRVDVAVETSGRFANLVAVSSRGLWVDITQWTVYAAAVYAIADLLLSLGLPAWAFLLYILLPSAILVALVWWTTERRKVLKAHGALRIFLFALGVAIACV